MIPIKEGGEMTDENKEKKCKCSLFLGVVVLAVGVITGIMGEFQLMQILAVVVGAGLILIGLKGSNHCKCCK